VELLVDYLVLVFLADHDYFIQHHHTLAAGSIFFSTYTPMCIILHIFCIIIFSFLLTEVFEEEHPPELTPELYPLFSQYPQQTQHHGFSQLFLLLDQITCSRIDHLHS
jgi:hypothetical protein